jgi:N-acetylglucosamine-6-phosphate deacetylase
MQPSLDIQHNGSHGLDFNADTWTLDSIPAWLQAHEASGGNQIFATLITAPLDAMQRRIARILQARRAFPEFAELVRGFHLEGPFISSEAGYVGAHPAEHVIPASVAAMERLATDCAGLLELVTLAPECDPNLATTRWLSQAGIGVAAGHTNASLDQLKAAVQAGLQYFTHVGNGCPAVLPRHDNIIQRALSLHQDLTLCFIPDGIHLPFWLLKSWLDGLSLERVILVTDAMTAAGMPPGRYTLGSSHILVDAGGVARAPDGIHLAGSTLTMGRLRENTERHLGLSHEEIERLVWLGPQRLR